jgi:hypothetical protein
MDVLRSLYALAVVVAGLVDAAKAATCHDLGEHAAGIAIMASYLIGE